MISGIEDENFKDQSGIIHETTTLSTTLYFSQALYAVRGFIIANVLGPSAYGVWSILRTIFSSAQYLGLGAQEAMMREVPFSLGEGNKERAPLIIQTSLSWNILLATCAMVITLILSFTTLITEYNVEIRLAGFVFVLNAIRLFLLPKFKSEKNIILLSKFILSYTVMNFVFGLSFLFLLKISGLLLGMLISHLILLSFMIIKGHLSLHLTLEGNILGELLKTGFPIMILGSIFFLMHNIDKFIVFALLGKTMTGYYGLAAFISSVVSHISNSVSTVLFPRIMHTYGKTRNTKDIEIYFTKPINVLAGLVPIILGIMYINVGMVLNLFLPLYIPSIKVLQILIIGLFFTTIWRLPTNMLIALNKQKMFMYIIFVVLISGIILDVLLIKTGSGINGVAIATACMFMVASVIANVLALLLLKKNKREILKSFGMIYLPFIYSSIGFLLISLIPISQQIIIDCIAKSIIYLVYCIPLFLYTEKKTGIMVSILDTIKKIKK